MARNFKRNGRRIAAKKNNSSKKNNGKKNSGKKNGGGKKNSGGTKTSSRRYTPSSWTGNKKTTQKKTTQKKTTQKKTQKKTSTPKKSTTTSTASRRYATYRNSGGVSSVKRTQSSSQVRYGKGGVISNKGQAHKNTTSKKDTTTKKTTSVQESYKQFLNDKKNGKYKTKNGNALSSLIDTRTTKEKKKDIKEASKAAKNDPLSWATNVKNIGEKQLEKTAKKKGVDKNDRFSGKTNELGQNMTYKDVANRAYDNSVGKSLRESGYSQKEVNEYLSSKDYQQSKKKGVDKYATKIRKNAEKAEEKQEKKASRDRANDRAEYTKEYLTNKLLPENTITDSERQLMTTWAMQGQLQRNMQTYNDNVDNTFLKRVGKMNVQDYVRSAGAMGALDQMTFGKSVSDEDMYKYTKHQKGIINQAKDSTAYKVGQFAGAAAEFGLMGQGAMAESLAGTVGKAGMESLVNAVKSGSKTATKQALKNIAKEGGYEALTSLPLNALDTVKAMGGTDDVNAKDFAVELLKQAGMDAAIGGGIAGIRHGVNATKVNRFNKIQNKINAGEVVSDADMDFFNTNYKTLAGKVADENGNIANAIEGNAGLSAEDVKTYSYYAEKKANGNLTKQESQKFAQVKNKVELAYKKADEEATSTLVKAVYGETKDLDAIKKSYKFMASTGDETRATEAKQIFDNAVAENSNMLKSMSTLTKATGVKFEIASPETIAKETKGAIGVDEIAKGVYLEQKDGSVKVLINEQSPQAHQIVAGHESGHIIKSASAEEFKSLGDALTKYAQKKGEYDDLVAEMSRNYVGESADSFEEEVVCEMIGRYIFGNDNKFIRQLSGEKPTIVQRIVDYIKGIVGKTDNKELRDMYTKILDNMPEKPERGGSLNQNYTAKVTTLKGYEPYSGDVPVQEKEKPKSITIDKHSVDSSRAELAKLNGIAPIKNFLKQFIPENGLSVKIDGVYFDGKPYVMNVSKKAAGKVASSGANDVKVAVFKDIKNVIKKSNYVGSAKYEQHSAKQKPVVRYDYFETIVDIGDEEYGVTIHSEVYSEVNNFRLHEVTKIEVEPISANVGKRPTAVDTDLTSTANISQPSSKIKTSKEKKPTEVGSFNAKQKVAKDSTGDVLDGDGNVTKKTDILYKDAVNRGKIDTAERLVKKVANAKLKDSKVRGKDGNLVPMYHSTISGEFTVFDKSKASVESDSGAGFYFSSSKADSVDNYATTTGADVENKISRRADEIMDTFDAEGEYKGRTDIDYDSAIEIAEEELYVGSAKYDVYLDVKNPVYVGKNETDFADSFLDGFESDLKREDFEDEWEFEDALDAERQEYVADRVEDVVYRVSDITYDDSRQAIREVIYEGIYDGRLTFDDLKQALSGKYLENEEGRFVDAEVTRAIAEELGYDGILDYSVPHKFRDMGLKDGDFHAIVFEPTQIKSLEPITRNDAGNVISLSERFNSQNKDIRFSKQKITKDSAGNNLSEGQQKFYKNSQAVDKDGNLQVYYHGTGEEFDSFDIGRTGNNYEGWSKDGKGVYLTTDKKAAKYWSENSRGSGYYIKELYANLENPFNTRQISKEAVSELFPKLVSKFKQNGVDNIEDILWMQKSMAEDGELDGGVFLDSFGAVEKENNGVTPFTAREFLEEQGYDGIMDYDVAVVFNENKVKYTSNTNPTEHNDLRFSKQVINTRSKEYKAKVDEVVDILENGGDATKAFEGIQKFIRDNATIEREITETVGTNLDALRSAKKYMREAPISLYTTAATQGKTVKHLLENVGADRKSIGSRLRINQKGGKSIEKAYRDLQEIDADRFPDVDTEEDMLRTMIDVSKESVHGEKKVWQLTDDDVESIIFQKSDELFNTAYAKWKKQGGNPMETIKQAETKEAPDIDAEVKKMFDEGKSEADVEAHLEEKGYNPYEATEIIDKAQGKSTAEVKEAPTVKAKETSVKEPQKQLTDKEMNDAFEGSGEASREYKEPNLNETKPNDFSEDEVKHILERSSRKWGKEDINQSAKNVITTELRELGGIKQLRDELKNDIKNGAFGKLKDMKESDAVAQATEEVERDYKDALRQYLEGDHTTDPNLQMARVDALLGKIEDRLKVNGDDAEAIADMMQIMEKFSSASTTSSAVMRSMKKLSTKTAKGRIGIAERDVKELNRRYKDRIKGALELTDEEKIALAKATPEEAEEIYKQITYRLWDNIPASWLEKFNEVRHCFMLLNPKTHERNLIGNITLKGIRYVANEIENGLQSKVFRKKIEKMGGEVDRVHVTHKEMSENKETLTKAFHDIYSQSNSASRNLETRRPSIEKMGDKRGIDALKWVVSKKIDGVPAVKQKHLAWLIQTNYKALELGDLATGLMPTFEKSYMQYVKAKGWDINALTPAQHKMAGERALFDAEYATFRDASKLSELITGKKEKLANSNIFGKMGNVVIESVLPFVKTPINIARRSVDYSPVGLVRGLCKLASSKDANVFKAGIKDLSTGLTGTGVFALGYFLASESLLGFDNPLADKLKLNVAAGSESGDSYYDQEMGYQNYSLEVNIGGKWKSFSLDWLSPAEVSLFMGAALSGIRESFGEGNSLYDDSIEFMKAMINPVLDMSFMSSTAEMMENFQERAQRNSKNGEQDIYGAGLQLLAGDVPKSYVGAIIPQLISQTAGASDKYQRDTRSTLENPILASWDTSLKQLANKVPVLRQAVLNPKLDRMGNNKLATGDNIVERILNSYFNPSTVKEITENKYDRELIKIRNSMKDKDSEDYQYFFYNFTGHPIYELANGKRMTYKDLYDYGKANRKYQWGMVKDMVDSDTYKVMPDSMKVSEVDDAHWVSTTWADYKTYGANYAVKALKSNEKTWEKEATTFNEFKALSSKGTKDRNETYIKYYIQKEKMYTRGHPSTDEGYRVKGLAAKLVGDKALYEALDIRNDKDTDIRTYLKSVRNDVKQNGGKVKDIVFKEVTNWCSGTAAMLKKANDADYSGVRSSLAAASLIKHGLKQSERIYRCMGHDWNSAQAGAGLATVYGINGKKGVDTITELENVKREIKRNFDVDKSGTITTEDVVAYIDSLNLKSTDHKACLFQSLSTANNPYSSTIKDHLKWGKNNDTDSGSGSGYGYGGWGSGWGYGGSGGSGGGSSSGISPKKGTHKKASHSSLSPVSSGSAPSAPTPKVTDTTKQYIKESNLNDAYRKKLKKALKN